MTFVHRRGTRTAPFKSFFTFSRRAAAFSWFSCALAVFAAGQAPPPKSVTTPEGEIPIPTATAPLGQKDAAALAELTKHLAVAGPSVWTGFQGKGKLTHAPSGTNGSNEGSGGNATLSILGGAEFRLDEQTADGTASIRIQNANGKIQDGDGKVALIPTDTAALGLFPFQRLGGPNGLGPATSLLDRGTVTVGGAQLRRITYEFAGTGIDPATNTVKVLAIDFYFDPATHLLVKSAASGQFPNSGHAHFLFVTTYGDFRRVGLSMVPFRYSETVNGEPYRTLQLSDVQLNPVLDTAFFQF